MFVYILRSQRTGRYYVGSTYDLERRLREHNKPEDNRSRWTRGAGPWDLVYAATFQEVAEARRAEKYVKRMRSRAFIEKLIRSERSLERFAGAAVPLDRLPRPLLD